jgi:hypothetical protein
MTASLHCWRTKHSRRNRSAPMVLSLPFAPRYLLATDAEALTQVLGVVYRPISAHVLEKASRLTRRSDLARVSDRRQLALNKTLCNGRTPR